MTTGADIADMLPLAAGVTTALSLKAVNFALAVSWPAFKLEEHATGGVLALNTSEYSLAAVTPAISSMLGVADVTIMEDANEAEVLQTTVRQHYDQTTGAWFLTFPPSLASAWSGMTFYVHYQYPHPQLTTLTGTVYAPINYMVECTSLWYDHYFASRQTVDNALWKALAPEFLRAQALANAIAYTPLLPGYLRIRRGRERLA